MTTYNFAFKKDLIAKLHEHFAEYQRDPVSVWKRIALELSTHKDNDQYRWQDLSAYFKRSLVYELGKFSNDQEFVDRMQYPCLRRVYSVVVELADKTPGVVTKRKEIVEDNKLFLKSLIDDSYDPAVVAAYKRRGNKKTRITVTINVGDPVYNLTPSQCELLMKMEQQRIRKNRKEKVRRQAEPGTWHNAATSSPVILDGVPVTIENAPSPAKNECSARRLLDEESLNINTQEYDQMIKDSLDPEMPPLPIRKRLLSISSTVESEDEVRELSFSTDADASDDANGISIPAEDIIMINPDDVMSESTNNTTTTLQLDPLQLSIQQSQGPPPPATHTAENAEKDSTTSEPLFTPSSGESAKSTTTEQLAPVPSLIFRTEDLIARSQPPTLILEENAGTEKRPTAVVEVERLERVEAAEVDDSVLIVISDERITEGPPTSDKPPNPEDPVVSATSSNGVNGGPVEPSVNVTRPGPVETTGSAVQNDEPAITDQTADRSIGKRSVATQTPPAKVIPVAAARAVAKGSALRRSLSLGNSTKKSIPRTINGPVAASYCLEDSDEEEEEEEEEPAANPTVEVQPAAAADKEVPATSNPPNEAKAEKEVRVDEVPEEPPVRVVKDGMGAEPEEPAVNVLVPDVAVVPAATVAVVSGVEKSTSFVVYSCTPLTAEGLVARSFFGDSDSDEEEEEEEPAANPTVEVQPAAAAEKEVPATSNPPNEAQAEEEVRVDEVPEEPPVSVVEVGIKAEPEEPAVNVLVPDVAVVPTPLTAEGLVARAFFSDSDSDEEEEEEEPAANSTVEVQPATDKEVPATSNPPPKEVEAEVEVKVEVPEEPSASVVEDGMETEPIEPAVSEVNIIEQISSAMEGNGDLNNNSQPNSSSVKKPPSSSPAPAAAPLLAPAPGTTHLARSYTPVPDSQDYTALQLWSNQNLLSRSFFDNSSDEESQVHDDHGSSNEDRVQETVVVIGSVAAPSKVVEKATDKPLPVETGPEKSTKNQEVVHAVPEETNSQATTSTAKRPPSPSPEPAAAVDPPSTTTPPPRAATPGTCHLARSCTPYPDSTTADYEPLQLWSNENILSGVGAIQVVASDEESEVDDDSDGSSSSNDDQVTEAVAVAAPSPIVEKATDKPLQVATGPEKSSSNQDVVLVSYSVSNTSSDGLMDGEFFWKEGDEEDDEESEEDDSENTSVEVQPTTVTNDPNCDEEPPLVAGNTVPAEPVVNPEPAPSSLPTPPSSSREFTPPPPVAAKSKLQRWHAHHAALEPFVRSHYTLYDTLRQSWGQQLFQPTAPIFRELDDLRAVITAILFSHLSPSNPARIVQLGAMVEALAIRIAYGITLQELEVLKEPVSRRPPPAAALPKKQDSQREIEVTTSSKSGAGSPPASKRIRIESSGASCSDVDDGGGQSGNVPIVTIELSDSEHSPSLVLPVRRFIQSRQQASKPKPPAWKKVKRSPTVPTFNVADFPPLPGAVPVVEPSPPGINQGQPHPGEAKVPGSSNLAPREFLPFVTCNIQRANL